MTFNPKKISLVSCKYGAPLGRRNRYDASVDQRVRLSHLIFVDGDYDQGGAYWGSGDPIWWCRNDNGTIELFVRANSREEAKQLLLKDYPDLEFKR